MSAVLYCKHVSAKPIFCFVSTFVMCARLYTTGRFVDAYLPHVISNMVRQWYWQLNIKFIGKAPAGRLTSGCWFNKTVRRHTDDRPDDAEKAVAKRYLISINRIKLNNYTPQLQQLWESDYDYNGRRVERLGVGNRKGTLRIWVRFLAAFKPTAKVSRCYTLKNKLEAGT